MKIRRYTAEEDQQILASQHRDLRKLVLPLGRTFAALSTRRQMLRSGAIRNPPSERKPHARDKVLAPTTSRFSRPSWFTQEDLGNLLVGTKHR